jgi:hypothetical protein
MIYDIDSNLENADWVKKTWDLPPIDSEEFKAFLKATGQTLEEIKHLPVFSSRKEK